MHAAEWLPDGAYRVRDDARRFENWETYYAGKVGLGVAADSALEVGVENGRERIRQLAGRLRELPGEADGVRLLDRDGVTAEQVTQLPRAEGINVFVMEAESAQLDCGARGIAKSVRSSLHYYNSEDELERLADRDRQARGRRADVPGSGASARRG